MMAPFSFRNLHGIFLLFEVLSLVKGSLILDGDVKIIGMFKIFESSEGRCGTKVDVTSVMTAEAVKWYIQQLNENAALPFTIAFEAFETCGLAENAGQIAVNIVHRALQGEKIIGIVGPELSSEAAAISPILNTLPENNKMVLVGFSTTARRLTAGNMLPNFVRVVPNDDMQVEMMVQFMMKLKWSRTAIIHENNIYGQDMTSQLLKQAEIAGICVPLIRQLSTQNEIYHFNEEIILGTKERPPIGGIVFIGSSSAAAQYISSLTTYSSTLPVVIFSEGTNLEKRVFTKAGGSANIKTFGNLVLSPAFTEVQEFSTHWKYVYSNASVFKLQNATNSWLSNVYFDLTGCVSKTCSFSPLQIPDLNKIFSSQSPFIQYAIVAAHTLVKGVIKVHEKYCGNVLQSCKKFENSFYPGEMLSAVKGLQVNLNMDFRWRPNSIRNLMMTIGNDTGDIIIPKGVPSYQMYNVHGNSTVDFAKVAELVDNDISVQYTSIRDYNAQGQELRWPNIRKAQCLQGKKCAKCIPFESLHEGFLFEPGDVYVVGIVPVFQKQGVQSCGPISSSNGYLIGEAIRFSVLNVRDRKGDFVRAFPNLKLGVIILNSCMSPAIIQRKILNLHKAGLTLRNGTVVSLKDKILGYVAEYSSTVSIAIADVLSVLGFVQVSYASTSPALSDRNKYPYFLRVVTPDDAQAKAITKIMMQLGFQYAQIVYSEGAYGEDGKNKVIEAAKNPICIAQSISVTDGENPFQVYEKLKKYPQAKVVILFLYPHVLLETVSALTVQMKKGEFVFIGSEIWARMTEALDADKNNVLLGSYTLSLEMYQDGQLRHYVREVKEEPFYINPWSSLFIQERNKCFNELSFDKTKPNDCSAVIDFRTNPNFVLDTFDTTAYIATISLLTGANEHLQKKCGEAAQSLCRDFIDDTLGLVETIKNVKLDLDGQGRKMKVFNQNGDGNVGYRIYNIQQDVDNPQKRVYEEVGRYPLEGTFTFEKDKIVFATNEGLISKCPNEEACKQCLKNETSEHTSAVTQKTSTEDEDDASVTVTVLAVFLALVIATIVIAAVMFWIRRKRRDEDKDLYLTATEMSSMGSSLNQTAGTSSRTYEDIHECSQGDK